MRVYIWGTGKLAEACIADLQPDIEIAGFVESMPNQKEFAGMEVISGRELEVRNYDYVILANSHEEDILREHRLDEKKVVYYRLSVECDSDQKVRFRRKKEESLEHILFQSQKQLRIVESARQAMPYISVQTDGLKFLFDSNDNLIANDMIGCGKTYSKKEMHFFYETAPKTCEGYFLDIGANIGTTSIYFRKNICDRLQYIAFEPLQENYKMLKVNCILNECEDIRIVNEGLSNIKGKKAMYIFDGAFGSSMILDNSAASAICEFTTLDAYVRENGVPAEKIAYLWVDVQCHELEVIEGGFNTLMDSPASLYIEFNIQDYRTTEGKSEKFLNLLAEIYNKFICYEQYEKGNSAIRDIQDLMKLPGEIDLPFCNLLLMK